MRVRVMQRGAVVAACLSAAGLVAVPFSGAGGADLVATGPAPAPTTTTTTVPPTTTTPPPAPAATAPPPPPIADAVVVEAPPIVMPDPGAGVGPATGDPAPAAPAPLPEPGPAPAEIAVPAEPAPVPAEPPADEPPAPAEPAQRPNVLRDLLDGLSVGGPGPARPPEDVPPDPATPDTTPPTRPPGAAHPERIWVVSIGIDDYPGDRFDLRAARNDAVTVTDALRGLGVPADHIHELLDGAATADAVVAAADWLVANAGPEDTAIFFYAGHIRDVGWGTEVLVTADGAWVADWYLGRAFGALQAQSTWFAIAGCYGGGFAPELLGPGRILTAAADPGELAYESSSLGRSYMVEYLFKRAIIDRRASEPTVQAAVAWAQRALRDDWGDFDLWHEDDSGRPVSLDGADRAA